MYLTIEGEQTIPVACFIVEWCYAGPNEMQLYYSSNRHLSLPLKSGAFLEDAGWRKPDTAKSSGNQVGQDKKRWLKGRMMTPKLILSDRHRTEERRPLGVGSRALAAMLLLALVSFALFGEGITMLR